MNKLDAARREEASIIGKRKTTEKLKKKLIMPLIPEEQVFPRVEEQEIPLTEGRSDRLECIELEELVEGYNRIVRKEMEEKELEKTRREQVITLDQVKVLERKLADIEATNAKLVETNSSLTEINERLTDDCAVKDRRIQSLNDLHPNHTKKFKSIKWNWLRSVGK
ncbi:hypothetical protein M9H77_25404 [Catharanthus roseus]|uniref:Uncharacterized protein n=1 Tax=Catharanthus roseus TaxID=4058 RepID=A0ACC0AAT7_CATRO|nr:hypothetical protein M9H77_25404 [Catharanthus roseus]